MMNQSILKRKIMIRVYMLFIIRKLKNPVAFEISIFAIAFLLISYMVSIQSVIANTPRDMGGFYHFWINAFFGTKLLVKTAVLAMIVVAGIFIKNATSYIYLNTNRLRIFARA